MKILIFAAAAAVSAGVVGIELRIFRTTSNDGRHPIVLGRKDG